MTMPAPGSAPPPYYPKRGNGCLWGCLILVLLLVIPPVLLGGYGAWFLYDGYKRSPVLRLVGVALAMLCVSGIWKLVMAMMSTS